MKKSKRQFKPVYNYQNVNGEQFDAFYVKLCIVEVQYSNNIKEFVPLHLVCYKHLRNSTIQNVHTVCITLGLGEVAFTHIVYGIFTYTGIAMPHREKDICMMWMMSIYAVKVKYNKHINMPRQCMIL